MAETERTFGKQLYNLNTYDRSEPPQIVLPHEPSSETIILAENFASVPPILDAVPRTDGRPYAIFPPDTKFSSPDKSKKSLTRRAEALDIVIVSDMDLKSAGAPKKIDRQFQRLTQFTKLLSITDAIERKLDGSLTAGQADHLRRLVRKLRHIAASWFDNEFLKDPISRLTVKSIVNENLPQTDAAIKAAEEHVDRITLKTTVIYNEAENILHPPLQKTIDKDTQKLASDVKANKSDRDSKQKPADITEKERAQEKITNEIIQGNAARMRSQQPKDIYVHDPIMDEPSSNAAEYFEELWNKPF